MAAFASEDNGQEGDLAAHDGGTDPESDNDDESIGDPSLSAYWTADVPPGPMSEHLGLPKPASLP